MTQVEIELMIAKNKQLEADIIDVRDRLGRCLNLSSYQQTALAELACLCASVKRHQQTTNEFATGEKFTDELNEIVEKRVSMNWGELYEKLHRSGANF